MRLALAIDGGNSKTDAALVREDGTVLGAARGAAQLSASPRGRGRARRRRWPDRRALAGRAAGRGAAPARGRRLPRRGGGGRDGCRRAAAGLERTSVRQRHVRCAAARAPTPAGAIAITCGAGINCVGDCARRPRGTLPGARSDHAATGAAAATSGPKRCSSRRAARTDAVPRTLLETRVAGPLRLRSSARSIAQAIHRGQLAERRLLELAPLVFELAADDAVAAAIVDRLVVGDRRAGASRRGAPSSSGGDVRRRARRRSPAARRAFARGCDRAGRPFHRARSLWCGRRRRRRSSGSALLVLDGLGAERRGGSRRVHRGLEERNRHDGRTRWLRFGTSRDTRLSGHRQPRGRRARPRDPRRRVSRARRPVWVRQDDALRMLAGLEAVTRARSSSATAMSPKSRRNIETSRWCSRTTRCTRT